MQSLLQLFAQDRNLQRGSIRDFPRFGERGFMIDAGRQYFEIAYIESLIRKLAWMKMNFIHLHFTEWQAFRLKSDLFPGLAPEQSYSKEDIRRIQEYAATYHIMVVPEIDLPAHAIQEIAPPRVYEAIMRVRQGNLSISPGYDGVFGTITIFDKKPQETTEEQPQMSFF